MPLYDPTRHEPPSGPPWDEALARGAIRRIVDDANRAFTPEGLWPIHPLDLSPERPPDCLKPLYNGAAGVIWTLERLAREGAAPLAHDFGPVVASLVERNREDIRRHEGVRAYLGGEEPMYLGGETGLLLLDWTHAPSPVTEAALAQAVAAKVGDVRGAIWGGAGPMLASVFLHERTGDERWRGLFVDHAEALWTRWSYVEQVGCHLWDQDLYGQTGALLGCLHGFAANVFALLRGRALLPPSRMEAIEARARHALLSTAVREDGEANWPLGAGPTTRPRASMLYLQHCFGAPGMIHALAQLPSDPEVDALALEAGALTWRAGPPIKPPCLCHGAPGGGYALLRLYARTGDPVWLDRGRVFAMHAIGQADRAADQHGQRKFSLWTGDLGLAVYLWDCIKGAAAFPMMDQF